MITQTRQKRWENCTKTEKKLAFMLAINGHIKRWDREGEEGVAPHTIVYLPKRARWRV